MTINPTDLQVAKLIEAGQSQPSSKYFRFPKKRVNMVPH